MATDGFKRIRAGVYERNFAYGYVGIITNDNGEWLAGIFLRDDNRELKAVELVASGATLRDAIDNINYAAMSIKVERENYLTRVKFMSLITTPHACDPSYETYHSM